MRIGTPNNLMVHLIQCELFEAACHCQTTSNPQFVQTEAGSTTEISYPCDSVALKGIDVPRPGDEGYPQLPLDAAASGAIGAAPVGNLLDVMA